MESTTDPVLDSFIIRLYLTNGQQTEAGPRMDVENLEFMVKRLSNLNFAKQYYGPDVRAVEIVATYKARMLFVTED